MATLFLALVARGQTAAPSPRTSAQQPATATGQQTAPSSSNQGNSADATGLSQQTSSSQFIAPSGLGVQQLVDAAFQRRADLIGARQRVAIAQGNLIQARLRPNPQLKTEYGSTRFLSAAPDPEYDLSAGITQLFETGGKRGKRIAVAELELAQAKAQVVTLERQVAADIRASYARALAAGRQLDTLERLIRAAEEQVRITTVRLNEGDVAPLDLNLVRNETDRLRAQVIKTRADLEGEFISLRALAGYELTEPLRIAPLPDRPPRLDLSLLELTGMALRERTDLQAARLGEQAAAARIRLAQSQAVPNVSGSASYSRTRRVTEFPEVLGVGPARQIENSLVFGVTIDLPVFSRNQGQIASAMGEREQARAQREFLEATIKRDVALAYNRYRAAAEALVLYATQIVPRAEANLQSVRNAYGEGEFSVFDIVNEQRRLIDNQTAYNDALRDYYSALADLERAIGTTIPATAFAHGPVSILPDETPKVDRETLWRSLPSKPGNAKPSVPEQKKDQP
jgi:cobalt-zinc-cadmium efflux system outer membrane protein